MLRDAVIAKNASNCTKNEQGSWICEAMKSVTATLALAGQSSAKSRADLLQGAPMWAGVAHLSGFILRTVRKKTKTIKK